MERARHARGEAVRGTVLGGSRGSTGEVRVALNLRERSTEYESVADSVPGGDGSVIPPGGTRPFAIELHEDTLPSVRTAHGGLVWAVDATDDSGPEPAASTPIEVVVREPLA